MTTSHNTACMIPKGHKYSSVYTVGVRSACTTEFTAARVLALLLTDLETKLTENFSITVHYRHSL